jgi:hypothetical protein
MSVVIQNALIRISLEIICLRVATEGIGIFTSYCEHVLHRLNFCGKLQHVLSSNTYFAAGSFRGPSFIIWPMGHPSSLQPLSPKVLRPASQSDNHFISRHAFLQSVKTRLDVLEALSDDVRIRSGDIFALSKSLW